MSLQERIRKVKELHQEGLSLGQIAEMVGVSKGTVYNYVNNYPYKA
jgi:transposase